MKLNNVIHSVWFKEEAIDCYTIIIQPAYFPAEEGYYNCIAMSRNTVSFCEFQRCTLGEHLGVPIVFGKLPKVGQEKILDMLHSKEDIEWMTHQIDYSIEEPQMVTMEVVNEDGEKSYEDVSGKIIPARKEE